MLSPRALVWGNPARAKFAAENLFDLMELHKMAASGCSPHSIKHYKCYFFPKRRQKYCYNIQKVKALGTCLMPNCYCPLINGLLGLYSLRRRRLISIGIPIINLRRSSDHLKFIVGIPIPVRWHLLSE